MTAVVTASTMVSSKLAVAVLFLTGVETGDTIGVYLTAMLVIVLKSMGSWFSTESIVTVGADAEWSTAVDTAGRTGVAFSLVAGRGGVTVTLSTPSLTGVTTSGVNSFLGRIKSTITLSRSGVSINS